MITTRRNLRGLTLVECVLAMVIVATMIVAALRATGAVAKSRMVQTDRTNGMTLARQLLSEIKQLAYSDPDGNDGFGAESGETRATFDDVNDYNGLSESPPKDRSGGDISGFAGWKRQVTVSFMDQGLLGTILNTDSGLEKITVVVTSPTGIRTTLTALRSSSSQYDKVATSQRTYVGQSVVTLELDDAAKTKVVSGANTMNQAP